MRILIIEDDMSSASGLKSLAERGIPAVEVRLATTLAGGIAENLMFKPELIVLDAELPDSGAFETLKQIPALRMVAGAGVVVWSAYEEEALVIAAFAAGATDFLTKPSPANTVNVVQRLIYGHLRTVYEPQRNLSLHAA